MKLIDVGGRNRLSFFAVVDDDDFEKISQYSIHDNGSGYLVFCVSQSGKQKTILLHRFIMNEYSKEKVIDHINHNTYDNRKENLKICTPTENNRNRNKIELPVGFIDTHTASKMLGKTHSYLCYLCKKGKIKKYKLLNRSIYKITDVEKIINVPDGYIDMVQARNLLGYSQMTSLYYLIRTKKIKRKNQFVALSDIEKLMIPKGAGHEQKDYPCN